MRQSAVCLVVLLAVGCGNGSSVVESDTGQDILAGELAADTSMILPDVPEVTAPDTGLDVMVFQDVGTPDLEPACMPGDGCLGDHCVENNDCQSGWCVQHLGESVCTVMCQDECPADWTCKLIAGSDPDAVYICVSSFANLCRPCHASAECKTPGTEGTCVRYQDGTSFCGALCDPQTEGAVCPWGFTCKESQSVEGVPLHQCVADAGECPCTQTSVDNSLSTPCTASSNHGTCTGLRICGEEGLSTCNATQPMQESCNGLDDNCDGDVDEPNDVGGDYVNLCNDDNVCTVDVCAGQDGCQIDPLDEGECLDGDACTIGDHCEMGVCIGMPIQCDDFDPCTDDSCDGLGGCLHTFNDADCDDLDPCTVADRCEEGTCAGVAVPCDCQTDADCGELEDGDLCNGTLACDLEQWPHKCTVVEETVVICPEPDGADAPCLTASCNPEDSSCSLVAAHEGAPCDDGDPCTLGDACVGGLCTGGPKPICKDDNPCTDDTCQAGEGCIFTPNQLPCGDGNVCTTEDSCVDGSCIGGPELICDDGNPCNGDENCDLAVGCIGGQAPDCDDGNMCNGVEWCNPSSGCVGGLPLACDDDDPCTDDSCDGQVGCVHQLNDGPCDDDNKCTTGDACQAGQCVYFELLDCDDGNVCSDDSCDPAVGCVYANNTAPCDDGDPCSLNTTCDAGQCQGQSLLDCDDGNACTEDFCDGNLGCGHEYVDAACDDGNLCTTGDQCVEGKCEYAELLDCGDSDPCTKESCDPDLGCVYTHNQAPCNDNDVCTLNDTCSSGVCEGQEPLPCNDSNVCTEDLCDAQTGCQFVPQDVACSDGNDCTENDWCVEGVCLGLTAVVCTDNNVCTADSCQPDGGCQFDHIVVPCDDTDPCTINDMCDAGVCLGGSEAGCDDENVCTLDGCEAFVGCTHDPQDGECTDNTECTSDDTCVAGQCTGTPVVCNDSDDCTEDSCDPEDGCQFVPTTPCCGNGVVEPGEACDDGNAVGGDVCSADCLSLGELNIMFTTCGASGPTGPGQGACDAEYNGKIWLDDKVTVLGGIQRWVVPFTGIYRITGAGAKTNGGSSAGGFGALIRGDLALSAGDELKILVGQIGTMPPEGYGGGSGGSFVARADNTPLLVAGGGGGHDTRYGLCAGVHGQSGQNGMKSCSCTSTVYTEGTAGNGGGGAGGNAGGGGFYTDGGGNAERGRAFVNGGGGGTTPNYGQGGFGGGSGTGDDQGGAGGGYSGGGGCGDDGHGGGGGSFNAGDDQNNQTGQNNGPGYVTVELVG